jgi:quinol monooxygenase YgiN
MFSVITTYPVAKGRERDFEATFAELQGRVIGQETGTVGFQLFASTEQRRRYKVIAHFRDQAAIDAHNSGPHLQALRTRLMAACDGAPTVEVFEAV